jgi:hypothetical protein
MNDAEKGEEGGGVDGCWRATLPKYFAHGTSQGGLSRRVPVLRPDLSLFLSRSGGREKRMVSFILVDRTHGRNEGQAEEEYVVLHLLSTQRDCARAVGSLARSPPSLAAELGETTQLVTARSAFLDSELQERMKERSMR